MFTRQVAKPILLLAALCLCAGCHKRTNANVTEGSAPFVTFANDTEPEDSIVLVFTGDVMLDRGVRSEIEEKGVKWLFRNEEKMFGQADAVIINLECPFADTLTPLPKQYIFHADTRWAKELSEVGITHAALANNHTNDQGLNGLRSTVSTLQDAAIVPLGIGRDDEERMSPAIIEKGKKKVALFNAVLFTLENWVAQSDNKQWMPNQVSAQQLAQAINKYKKENGDTKVIAVVHWGSECETTANLQQKQQARMLISAGADMIVGHHPHVIQPMQMVFGKPVYYSLGNYIFERRSPADSAVIEVKL